MKEINILSAGFTSPNGAAFLFPLIKFKQTLKDQGFKITIFNSINKNTINCDYLFIDSKFFKHNWTKDFNATIDKIASLNAQTKVIWCDQSDSTGTFLGQVLPHVHYYLKAQLLKDRTQYMQTHYASRIFTNYYHKKYGIKDKDNYIKQPIKKPKHMDKLGVSWNSAFMNYGLISPYLPKIRNRIPLNALLQFTKPIKQANSPRNIDITCRMGISYARNTVCYQRKQMQKILSKYLLTDKLSRQKYFKEISNSKICVSPFGLGEITLKDFECFLTGSMLLKPDMSHMETWPNLFEDKKTCIFHNWDLDDVIEKIDWALTNKNERINIAQNAQNRYLDHTINKNAPHIFAKHFEKTINEFNL